MTNVAYSAVAEYIKRLRKIEANGFDLPSDVSKIFSYETEISNRISRPWSKDQDALDKAVYRLDEELRSDNGEETDRKILLKCGLSGKEPYEVFYDKTERHPGSRYVIAFFIDRDESRDQGGRTMPRNCGEGERFYGCGKSKTRSDFLLEIRKWYRDCPWTEVYDVSEVHRDPDSTVYSYRGFLYTKPDQEGKEEGQ